MDVEDSQNATRQTLAIHPRPLTASVTQLKTNCRNRGCCDSDRTSARPLSQVTVPEQPKFWIYNLRHTFASRMSAAGVSDLFVGQIIGHKTPGILQKYSRAIDEYRRDAVRKLEDMRAKHAQRDPTSTTIN